jgi:hypothetical protein
MSEKRADDLAQLCTDAVRKGNDFPTIWDSLLKRHLVRRLQSGGLTSAGSAPLSAMCLMSLIVKMGL